MHSNKMISGVKCVETYSPIPHRLIRDRTLIATDTQVIGVLLEFARDKATCWPSVLTIAKAIGRTERTVQYSLARLIKSGWISTRPAPNKTGREIVLSWRVQSSQKPGVKTEYSQGLPRVKGSSIEFAPQKEEKKNSALAQVDKTESVESYFAARPGDPLAALWSRSRRHNADSAVQPFSVGQRGL